MNIVPDPPIRTNLKLPNRLNDFLRRSPAGADVAQGDVRWDFHRRFEHNAGNVS